MNVVFVYLCEVVLNVTCIVNFDAVTVLVPKPYEVLIHTFVHVISLPCALNAGGKKEVWFGVVFYWIFVLVEISFYTGCRWFSLYKMKPYFVLPQVHPSLPFSL